MSENRSDKEESQEIRLLSCAVSCFALWHLTLSIASWVSVSTRQKCKHDVKAIKIKKEKKKRRAMQVWWQFLPLIATPLRPLFICPSKLSISICDYTSIPSLSYSATAGLVMLPPHVQYIHTLCSNKHSVCAIMPTYSDHSTWVRVCAHACVHVMTVSSSKASPTQTLDNSQISTLSPSSEDKGGGWGT